VRMKLAILIPLSLLLCLFAPFLSPDAEAAQLTFSLYALGIQVAESVMTVDLGPSGYRMGLRYHTTGLASVFSGDGLNEQTGGGFDHDSPIPLEFRSSVRLHGQDRIVTLTYRNGSPAETALSPPNEGERDVVPVVQREHTFDPLSATVAMMRLAARTGRCDLSHRTYDGRRLELFEARTAGEEDLAPSARSSFSGRALRCDYTSKTLAGFRLGDGRDEDSRPRKGTIWLAQVLAGAPRLPVRGLIDTRFLGSATMYLTAAAP
jgi:hypothetical protein